MRRRIVMGIALALVLAVAGYVGSTVINAGNPATAAKAAPEKPVQYVQTCPEEVSGAGTLASGESPSDQPPMEGVTCIHCISNIDCNQVDIGTECSAKPQTCYGICRRCPAGGPIGCFKTP